jgi:hypothetical protein
MSRLQVTRGDCCPKCGAKLSPGQSKCWLCLSRLADQTIVLAECVAEGDDGRRLRFGVSAILLSITLAAILCSIFAMNPGLGILAAVLLVPALLRTLVVASRREKTGKPMSAGRKALTFSTSVLLGVTALAAGGAAAFATFFLSCVVALSGRTRNLDANLNSAAILSGVVGVLVAVAVGWLAWMAFTRNRQR